MIHRSMFISALWALRTRGMSVASSVSAGSSPPPGAQFLLFSMTVLVFLLERAGRVAKSMQERQDMARVRITYIITCLCCIKWLGFQHPRHGTPQVPSFRPEELLGDLEFHDLQLLWSSVQPWMRHPQNYRPTKMVPEAVQYADKKSGWLFFSSRNKFLWL